VSKISLNVCTWQMERELNYLPSHFVVSKTPITHESKQWILESLNGRFCVVSSNEIEYFTSSLNLNMLMPTIYPAFEDPQEAVFYELKFS